MFGLTGIKRDYRKRVDCTVLLLGGLTTFGLALVLLTPPPTAALAQAKPAGKPAGDEKPGNPKPQERFDMLVRDDFFAGMNGQKGRLEKGMKLCEDTLEKNPRHAQALVWHGGGLMFESGALFQAGDTQKGMAMWQKGLDEMDRAVALEPNNIAVRIPRGASLIGGARYVPDPKTAKMLYERGVSDYEKTYALQKPGLARLSVHSRGELLFGLAEAETHLGQEEKARSYLHQVLTSCKGSDYEKEARTWLAKKTLAGSNVSHNCIGCHTK